MRSFLRWLGGLLGLVILLTTASDVIAQTGVNGTWRVEGGGTSWEVVLRSGTSGLIGKVSHCATSGPADIYDGRVDGNTITFTCFGLGPDRTLAFNGVIDRDSITFTWAMQVREDRLRLTPNNAGAEMFGPSAPARFTAKRIPDSDLSRAFNREQRQQFSSAINLPERDVKAEGALLLPEAGGRVRFVMVALRWGLGGPLFDDPQTQSRLPPESAFLRVAISHIRARSGASVNNSAGLGGDQAVMRLLKRLGEETGHAELTDAPLVIWGHSAAGPFGSSFAGLHPERTLAFVRYHSGVVLGGDMKVVSRIPALLFIGEKDTTADPAVGNDSQEGPRALWRSGRSANAPWAFAFEPNATHGDLDALNKAYDLLIPWLNAVVRTRLSENGTLRSVREESGWLGDNRTGDIAPYTGFNGSKNDASWFPDEASAREWRGVIGAVK